MFSLLLRSALAVAVLACGAATADAQTDYGDRKASSMLSAGLTYLSGGSMIFNQAENWKLLPVHAYRAGVDATYPLTPVISASLFLGIDNRGTAMYWFDDPLITEIRRVNYFSITPGFMFSAFRMSLNIGIPTGGGKIWQNTIDGAERTQSLDFSEDELSVMIEPRIGAVIRVLDTEVGFLGVVIEAGYNVNSMSERDDFFPNQDPDKSFGSNTISAHGGVTWQFGIPGTARK